MNSNDGHDDHEKDLLMEYGVGANGHVFLFIFFFTGEIVTTSLCKHSSVSGSYMFLIFLRFAFFLSIHSVGGGHRTSNGDQSRTREAIVQDADNRGRGRSRSRPK